MSLPKLSVVVPIGPGSERISNVETWLKDALAEDIEVILVHDSNIREEQQQFKILAESHKHQRLRTTQVSYGNPGETRNSGIQFATGTWIAFWDSDDLPLVVKFLEMIKIADQKDFLYSVGGFQVHNSESGEKSYYSPPNDHSSLATEIAVTPGIWRFAFRSATVKGIRFNSFPMGEDQDFLIEAIGDLSKLFLYSSYVYEYRQSVNGQLTSDRTSQRKLSHSLEWLTDNQSRLIDLPFFIPMLSGQLLSFTKLNLPRISITQINTFKIAFPSLLLEGLKILLAKIQMHNRSNAITVYLAGGLGNQLFQLAAATKIADGKQVKVIIANISTDELLSALDENKYKILARGRTKRQLDRFIASWMFRSSTKSLSGKVLQKFFIVPFILTKLSMGINANLQRIKEVGYSGEFNKEGNFLIGYFQSYKYVDRTFSEKFLLNTLDKVVLSTINKYKRLAEIEQPILIHIRLGDYRAEKNFGTPDVTYYLNSLNKLYSNGINRKIWLFSNEPEIAFNIFPTSIKSLIRVIREPNLSPLGTLQIMKLCKDFIIGNSTFSWWAAFASTEPNRRVVYPTPWFSGIESPKDLTPPDWIPLESRSTETF